MSINPGATRSYFWNYSNPSKDGYSTMLVGTVKNVQEVQGREYNPGGGQPGRPQFWPDGKPKMNIRLILVDDNNELKTFTFTPAGRAAREGKKPSVHMDLWRLSGGEMRNLIGKTIFIKTQEGHYGQGNPRPWEVGFADEGYGPFDTTEMVPEEFMVPRVLCDEAVHGGQMQQPAQRPQYQPTQYQQQQAPMYQQQPARAMADWSQPPQQSVYQQPAMPQMNPQIAQQMVSQAFGAPVQVMQQPGYDMPYDPDMPF